ncbi:SGNH/GDSL hydrolase family protein [Planctomicrobium sp. SH661]|uniref:SGNH/GDSL hydrolase family protein n=1 Tax=Planctomicrobium sp. SH661 TaxID=3448124 RepID=UPI003F5C4345
MLRPLQFALLTSVLLSVAARGNAAEPPELKIVGERQIAVTLPAATDRPAQTKTIDVEFPTLQSVVAEKHDALPLYNPAGPQYARGARLNGILAEALTAPDLLDPDSVVVRLVPEESGEAFMKGKDYDFEPRWGGIGRLPEGRIPEQTPVYISYRHTLQRLDSIILTPQKEIIYRQGVARPTNATPPDTLPGEERLANIWFTRTTDKLNENMLFPILEAKYPEPERSSPSVAERLIPKTMQKLQSGGPVKILAWGDSVTEGAYLANRDQEGWQAQFVARLQQLYPDAKIELVTEAWGGRSTSTYLGVPPGEPHNYKETVLAVKPDLIISEFVNDAGLNPAQVEDRYSRLLGDFQGIGAEWIILAPHYVRPDWMGLDRERDIDEDPRPYVHGLREFSKKHDVALADAAKRYGRLWRQGIPYNSLMMNCINHPDPRGLQIFADSLIELFPQK